MFSSVKLLAIFSDNRLIMFCRNSIINKLDSVGGARRFDFSKDPRKGSVGNLSRG